MHFPSRGFGGRPFRGQDEPDRFFLPPRVQARPALWDGPFSGRPVARPGQLPAGFDKLDGLVYVIPDKDSDPYDRSEKR